MSLAQTRTDIATALSTVADCRGYSKRPAAPNVGDGWPVLGPLDRATGTAFEVTWLVRVFVPQDEVAASDWWDAHWPALFTALHAVGFIDRAAPTVIPTQGTGDQLAFEITMRAEE